MSCPIGQSHRTNKAAANLRPRVVGAFKFLGKPVKLNWMPSVPSSSLFRLHGCGLFGAVREQLLSTDAVLMPSNDVSIYAGDHILSESLISGAEFFVRSWMSLNAAASKPYEFRCRRPCA